MSVTAGTIFQDSHLPLTIWFRAMWQVTSQKNGISALGLQRVLGLGSYKTAWAVRPGRERLSGRVEADKTYLGGLEERVRGRQTESKALIVVAAEEDGNGIGRIRIAADCPPARCPVCSGSSVIRPSIAPNRCRVRCPSDSSSQ